MKKTNSFTIKGWVLTNFYAFTLSYCLYGLIAHGFTGGHTFIITTPQIYSHSIALIVVACIVGFFQYRYLKSFIPIRTIEIVRVILLFLLFFWLGWYLGKPPFDSLLGFTALGCSLWLVKGTKNLGFGNKILGFFSFFIGAIGGLLVAIVFSLSTGIDYTGEEVGWWKELWTHGVMWLMMAIPTAILSGYISGIVLNRNLKRVPS